MVREVLAVIGSAAWARRSRGELGSGRDIVLADCDAQALNTVAAAMTDDGFSVWAHAGRRHRCIVGPRPRSPQLAGARSLPGPHCRSITGDGLGERNLAGGSLGTAHVLDAFGEVIALRGAGVVTASMAGTILALIAEP